MAEFKKLINPPIKANEINSESATQGQVLTANGTGGATWQNATEVVANPVLVGTESDLTGLEVAGTKYKVPTGGSGGGTQLYLHEILVSTGGEQLYLVFISSLANSINSYNSFELFLLSGRWQFIKGESSGESSSELITSINVGLYAESGTILLSGIGVTKNDTNGVTLSYTENILGELSSGSWEGDTVTPL